MLESGENLEVILAIVFDLLGTWYLFNKAINDRLKEGEVPR